MNNKSFFVVAVSIIFADIDHHRPFPTYRFHMRKRAYSFCEKNFAIYVPIKLRMKIVSRQYLLHLRKTSNLNFKIMERQKYQYTYVTSFVGDMIESQKKKTRE